MTKSQAVKELCLALGWQGGTIHQVIREVKDLARSLKYAREDADSYRRMLERLQKRHLALKNAITSLSDEDKAFMQAFNPGDPDLNDVFNEILYSYGRAKQDGTCHTRINCPHNPPN